MGCADACLVKVDVDHANASLLLGGQDGECGEFLILGIRRILYIFSPKLRLSYELSVPFHFHIFISVMDSDYVAEMDYLTSSKRRQ